MESDGPEGPAKQFFGRAAQPDPLEIAFGRGAMGPDRSPSPPPHRARPEYTTPLPRIRRDFRSRREQPRSLHLRMYCHRLHAIGLENIRGITFFYSTGSLYGVYAHSSTRSCALPIFSRFAAKRQQHTVWVYLPISQYDRVVAFGTQRNDQGGLNLVVRVEKSPLNIDLLMNLVSHRAKRRYRPGATVAEHYMHSLSLPRPACRHRFQ